MLNLNHVCSHYWNLPNTSTNSVNFQENPHAPQDNSENYPFFQQNRNKQQTPYHTKYLSSDDDDYHQPHNFARYTTQRPQYRTQRPRQFQPSHNIKIYPQNPADMQNQQPMHIQNLMTMHSYQPTQMQNDVPLPYYLQQHEKTKNQLTNFSQMPNAAESLQMTMNPYLMVGSSITSNKPLMMFKGTYPEYFVEDYLNAVTANLILNIGTEPINTPLHQNWIPRRTALIQMTLDGAAQK